MSDASKTDLLKLHRAFKNHKGPAKGRRDKTGKLIEFRLTFDEWLQIWVDSGHLHERGCKKGQYCMSRIGDIGHYEVGNVFIQRHGQNVSDALKGRPKSIEHRAKISAAMLNGREES